MGSHDRGVEAPCLARREHCLPRLACVATIDRVAVQVFPNLNLRPGQRAPTGANFDLQGDAGQVTVSVSAEPAECVSLQTVTPAAARSFRGWSGDLCSVTHAMICVQPDANLRLACGLWTPILAGIGESRVHGGGARRLCTCCPRVTRRLRLLLGGRWGGSNCGLRCLHAKRGQLLLGFGLLPLLSVLRLVQLHSLGPDALAQRFDLAASRVCVRSARRHSVPETELWPGNPQKMPRMMAYQ